jgi:hypothetical protein
LVRATKDGTAVIHTLRCEEVETRFPGLLSAVLAAEQASRPPPSLDAAN